MPRKPTNLYPSRLRGFEKCQVNAVLRRFMDGQTHTPFAERRLAVGTDIHEAIEGSIDFLRKEKERLVGEGMYTKGSMPGAETVEKIILQSQKQAEASLKLHTSRQSMQGIRDTLKELGGRYLSKKSVDLYAEKELVSDAFPWSRQIAGKLDVLLVDKEKEAIQIFDTKTTAEIHALMDTLNPATDTQAQFYTWLAHNNAAANLGMTSPKNVEFVYNIIGRDKGGKASRIALSHVFSPQDIGKIPEEISVKIAQMQTVEMIAYERIRNQKGLLGIAESLDAVQAHMSKLGGCNPSACKTCPMRFNCAMSDYIGHVVGESDPKNFEFGPSKPASKEIREAVDHFEKGVDESKAEKTLRKTSQLQKARERGIERMRRELEEAGLEQGLSLSSDDEARLSDAVRKRLTSLDRSYEVLENYSKTTFQSAVEEGAVSAQTRLPFSLLGEGRAHLHQGRWMSDDIRTTFSYIARERIKEVSGSLGIRHQMVERKAMDLIFTDKRFAEELEGRVTKNIRRAIADRGIELNRENVATALKRYDLTIDKDITRLFANQIDRKTLGVIAETNYEELVGHLSATETRKALSQGNLGPVLKELKGQGVLEDQVDEYWKRLARSETIKGLGDKFRLSAKKLPVRSLTVAALLTYIAGTFNIRRTLERKTEKAVEHFQMSHDEIDDGTHASPLTSVRRILNTDFGSETNPYPNRRSMTEAEVSVRSPAFKRIRDWTVSLFGAAEQDSLFNGLRGKLQRSIKSLMSGKAFTGAAPGGAFSIALGAGVVLAGLLPNVKTDREIGEEYQKREQRLKQLKRTKWNTDSAAQRSPESDLRRGYRLHTDFGSPWSYVMNMARAISRTDIADEAVGLVNKMSQSLSRFSGLSTRLRKQAAEYIPEKVATDNVLRARHKVEQYAKKAGAGMREKLDDIPATQKAREKIDSMRGMLSRQKEGVDTYLKGRIMDNPKAADITNQLKKPADIYKEHSLKIDMASQALFIRPKKAPMPVHPQTPREPVHPVYSVPERTREPGQFVVTRSDRTPSPYPRVDYTPRRPNTREQVAYGYGGEEIVHIRGPEVDMPTVTRINTKYNHSSPTVAADFSGTGVWRQLNRQTSVGLYRIPGRTPDIITPDYSGRNNIHIPNAQRILDFANNGARKGHMRMGAQRDPHSFLA